MARHMLLIQSMLRILLISGLLGSVAGGALHADAISEARPATLEAGYRQMYNLQFAQAHETFRDWEGIHPDDPLAAASDAAQYLFAEFDRMHILQSEFFTHDQHFTHRRRVIAHGPGASRPRNLHPPTAPLRRRRGLNYNRVHLEDGI